MTSDDKDNNKSPLYALAGGIIGAVISLAIVWIFAAASVGA